MVRTRGEVMANSRSRLISMPRNPELAVVFVLAAGHVDRAKVFTDTPFVQTGSGRRY